MRANMNTKQFIHQARAYDAAGPDQELYAEQTPFERMQEQADIELLRTAKRHSDPYRADNGY